MSRKEFLQSIANTIFDYRAGEIEPRAPDLIDSWVRQFPANSQEPLLGALSHVFEKTYISREAFKRFLRTLASTDKLCPGSSPDEYWRCVNLLDIQQGGNSQTEILGMFDEVLQEIHGFGIGDTGSEDGEFVYLDDCIGTGSRVRSDICAWIESDAPSKITLHIVTPVLYLGSWWIDNKIITAARDAGKTISIKKWRLESFEMENRLSHRNEADVLWPTVLPDDPAVQEYLDYLVGKRHSQPLRAPGNTGASHIFADDQQKILLEQQFLLRGCQLRQKYTHLPEKARPLGYHNLDSFGFGSMFVTYRNCPNNCPLALWIEQDDYPALFPRKTNAHTADVNFLRELLGE